MKIGPPVGEGPESVYMVGVRTSRAVSLEKVIEIYGVFTAHQGPRVWIVIVMLSPVRRLVIKPLP